MHQERRVFSSDLVGLEQQLDAAGKGGDGGLLGLHQVAQVELHVRHGNAALLHVSGLEAQKT